MEGGCRLTPCAQDCRLRWLLRKPLQHQALSIFAKDIGLFGKYLPAIRLFCALARLRRQQSGNECREHGSFAGPRVHRSRCHRSAAIFRSHAFAGEPESTSSMTPTDGATARGTGPAYHTPRALFCSRSCCSLSSSCCAPIATARRSTRSKD